MPNALNTAITGLVAHQQKLNNVANNIANLNTTAFKSSRVEFADLIYETQAAATSGTPGIVGGTNPRQVGSGVVVSRSARNMSQGTIQATGKQFDFAIDGEGFFAVANTLETIYTRAGSFSLDADGYLVDPATGYFVQRHGTLGEGGDGNPAFQVPGDSSIQVPIGASIGGTETEDVELEGNLFSGAIGPRTEVLTTASPMQESGAPAVLTTRLRDLDSNTIDYAAGDRINISGANIDGSTYSGSLNANPNTTVGDLVDFINTLTTDSTASLGANGNITVTADSEGEAFLSLEIEDDAANTGRTDFGDHQMLVTTDGKFGDTFNSTVQLYDKQGGVHTIGYQLQKIADNSWDLNFSIDPNEGTIVDGGIRNINFDQSGNFLSFDRENSANLKVLFNGIPSTQDIDISLDKLTQFAINSEINAKQDGRAPGKLVKIQLQADGSVVGLSSNGDRLPIAQLALATFRNTQGLSALGNNYYQESLNSGVPQIGIPATGDRGSIQGGQLEGSNVDIAQEFTELIVAQKGFQANARTITISDEMLEEVTNILR